MLLALSRDPPSEWRRVSRHTWLRPRPLSLRRERTDGRTDRRAGGRAGKIARSEVAVYVTHALPSTRPKARTAVCSCLGSWLGGCCQYTGSAVAPYQSRWGVCVCVCVCKCVCHLPRRICARERITTTACSFLSCFCCDKDAVSRTARLAWTSDSDCSAAQRCSPLAPLTFCAPEEKSQMSRLHSREMR